MKFTLNLIGNLLKALFIAVVMFFVYGLVTSWWPVNLESISPPHFAAFYTAAGYLYGKYLP